MKIVIGDILTPNRSDDKILVCHQVNCKGVMGAGLANQVRKQFPKVFRRYKDKCSKAVVSSELLGEVQYCTVLYCYNYVIANIFGQDGYGIDKQYTDYDALRKAFRSIATSFADYIVRIPYKMGCGLGGGDWAIVESIINEELIEKGVCIEFWSLAEEGAFEK